MMSPNWPCSRSLQVLNKFSAPATAILWRTFGKRKNCIRRFLHKNRARPHLIEIHPINNVYIRNGTTQRGTLEHKKTIASFNAKIMGFDPKLESQIINRIATISKFIEKARNKNTKIILSLGLEDDYTEAAAKRIDSIFRYKVPYELARNPQIYRADSSISEYIELHGYNPRRLRPADEGACIANGDGDFTLTFTSNTRDNSVKMRKVRRWAIRNKRHGCIRLLWFPKHQGITGTRFILPSRRSFIVNRSDHLVAKKVFGGSL